MSINTVRKELFKRITELTEEIKEGEKHGKPHLVGEVVGEDPPKVELNVVIFSGQSHKILLKDGNSLLFLFPVTSQNPRRVFLDLWMFLNGRESKDVLEPGATFRGVLKNVLKRQGFEVIWMSVQENHLGGYVEVIATRENSRYRMIFEKKGDMFTLLQVERV
jgi:hypothetical protein